MGIKPVVALWENEREPTKLCLDIIVSLHGCLADHDVPRLICWFLVLSPGSALLYMHPLAKQSSHDPLRVRGLLFWPLRDYELSCWRGSRWI